MMDLRTRVTEQGYALVPQVVDAATLTALQDTLAEADFAARNLMTVPAIRTLAYEGPLAALARLLLGDAARPVKATLFDKTPAANWGIRWHQDQVIAVQAQRAVPGFRAWSEKAGVPHVQPPAEVLEEMLALRLHLDDCDADNGALRVLPGSHRHGKLSPEAVAKWKAHVHPVVAAAQAGDVLAMRPLLLHQSGRAVMPRRRRVVHLEYARAPLPGGLVWYAPEATTPRTGGSGRTAPG